jgi:hypothetical protein
MGRGASSQTPSTASCSGLFLALLWRVDLSYARSAQEMGEGAPLRILPTASFLGCSLTLLWKDNESPVTLRTGGSEGLGSKKFLGIAELRPRYYEDRTQLEVWYQLRIYAPVPFIRTSQKFCLEAGMNIRLCDVQWELQHRTKWPVKAARGRTAWWASAYAYEPIVTWTCDLALARFPKSGLWLPLVRLRVWASLWSRELRQHSVSGVFEEHACKAMTMPPEGNGVWGCEECGDEFLNSKALHAHYPGQSHQIKGDLKDLADAKEESDVERARAQVAQDRQRDDIVHLRERHEEQQRAHMAVKLTQARAEAEERDRGGEDPEEEAEEEAEGEAEGEVVIVKVTPASEATKQVPARRRESGGAATGSGTAMREVADKIAREKRKAQEDRERKEAKAGEEEDRACVLGLWKEFGQKKLNMAQRLETGRQHLTEKQFGVLKNMVANTRKEQLRDALSSKDAEAAEGYRKAAKVALALDRAEAAEAQAKA